MIRCNGQQQVTASLKKVLEENGITKEKVAKVYTGGEIGTAGSLGGETEIQ